MSWVRHLAAFADFSVLEEPRKKPVVLVAGYGWATHSFVEHISHKDYTVKVISERNQRLNQNRMIGPLTPSYTPALLDVIQDTCISVDKEAKRLRCANGDYTYDYLVIATGSEAHDFGVPGVKQYCQMCKTDKDIVALRATQKESAIVLGAGPTGIELACSLQRRGMTGIKIIEGASIILPGFSTLYRSHVEKHLNAKGIQVHLNRPITSIGEHDIKTALGPVSYNERDLLVWTCGVRPVEFVRSLEPKGVMVNDQLQYAPNIYVLGDASKNKGPPTAQNASQQGRYLAELFNSKFTKKEPYTFKEIGRCLDLGHGHLIEFYGFVCFVPYMEWKEMTWMLSN